MNSAETKPKEPGLGKPYAGKPLARFDERGELETRIAAFQLPLLY